MPLSILIPAAIALILLIVIIRIYPILHIHTAKVFFGKYSSAYLAIYKRYTGQNPYAYCIKDDFINHIAGFYKKSNKLQEFNSSQDITFLDTDYGTSFSKVRKMNKKQLCLNANRLREFDLKVLGYRDIMFTAEMKKYFFFANGKFFLGELTFKNPNQKNIQQIVAVLAKKYLNGKIPETDTFLINGSNKTSLLCTNNGFHLKISYLSLAMSEVNSLLEEYWANTTQKTFQQSPSLETELMERL
jgi:hypothetical protein